MRWLANEFNAIGGKTNIRGRTEGVFLYLPALGEEGSNDDGPRNTQLFAAEVGFGHVRLHGDCLLVAKGDGRHRPIGADAISKLLGKG